MNSVDIIIDKIEKLFDSDNTSYRIAKEIGSMPNSVNRYRNGSDVENMTLGYAKRLIDYIERLENSDEQNNQ